MLAIISSRAHGALVGAGVFDCCDGDLDAHHHRNPTTSYAGNLTFLQLVFGYLLGRVLIVLLLLPGYFRGEFLTAYALIEKRFGEKMRAVAASTFLITRGWPKACAFRPLRW